MARRLSGLTLSFLLGSLSILACGVPDEPGPKNTSGCTGFDPGALILNGPAEEFNATSPTTAISLGVRFYYWRKHVGNLCVAAPSSANRVDFSFDVEPGTPALDTQGYVYAPLGAQPYSEVLARDGSNSHYTGTISPIGLRQGSLDGNHGSVDILMSIGFPTKGTEAADLTYAKSFLNKIYIKWSFETLTP